MLYRDNIEHQSGVPHQQLVHTLRRVAVRLWQSRRWQPERPTWSCGEALVALVFNLEAEQSRRGDQSQAKLTHRIGIVLEDSHKLVELCEVGWE